MVRILASGCYGWLGGIVPLIVVNALGYENILSPAQAALYGASALVLGIVLGGVFAGHGGARPRRRMPGSFGASAGAGVIAALLYLATLFGIVAGARHLGVLPPLLVEHPIRMAVVALFLGGALLVVAIFSGWLTLRGQTEEQQEQIEEPLAATGALSPDARHARQRGASQPNTGMAAEQRQARRRVPATGNGAAQRAAWEAPQHSRPLIRAPYPAPASGYPGSGSSQDAESEPRGRLWNSERENPPSDRASDRARRSAPLRSAQPRRDDGWQ